MRVLLLATAFALACAATAAAQSGRRVKPAEPAAQPSPEQQSQGDAQQDTLLRLVKRDAVEGSTEPERDEAGDRVYTGRQVDRRVRFLSRPEPGYPRRARRGRVEGTVVLRVVLGATGKVERITVIRGLPEGVTEEAIKAARAIKFEPAEKDGRKVSQSVIIEYNFNVY